MCVRHYLPAGIVVIVTLLLFSCPAVESPTYSVRFTLHGTDYFLRDVYTGFNAIDTGANGCLDTSGPASTVLAAVGDYVSDMTTQGLYVYIEIAGSTEGAFTGSFHLMKGDGVTDYYAEIMCELLEVGPEIGDEIHGTFYGMYVTDGTFTVQRVADNAIDDPF